MSATVGLMHAIHDQPDDDLPRLAFADWLEEHGDADRAEFVRLQVALARLPAGDPRRRELAARERELIVRHKDRWFGTCRSAWRWWECRRGFIEEVWGPAESVVPHADWLHQHHAVLQLRLAVNLPDVKALLRSPLVGILRVLHLGPLQTYGSSVEALPDRCEPLERRPLELFAGGLGLGVALVQALAASPHLGRLTFLDLSANRLGADGVQALLDHLPSWPRLERLNLAGGHRAGAGDQARPCIGNEGIVRLAGHPHAARLRHLNLSENQLGESGVRALVESPYLGGLELLSFHGGQGRRPGAGPFAQVLRRHFGARVAFGGEE